MERLNLCAELQARVISNSMDSILGLVILKTKRADCFILILSNSQNIFMMETWLP